MTEKLQPNSNAEEERRNLFEIDPEEYAKRYLAYLDIKLEDLLGKKVLEIGPADGKFAKVALEKGIDITTMDKRIILPRASLDVPAVRAKAEDNFPFKDEVFDIIISRFAPPTTFSSRDDVINFVNETMRVLKEDGRFVFSSLPRAYYGGEAWPKDSDPAKPEKDKEALEIMEADIGLPIETVEVNCQNINIQNLDKPEYSDTAYTIRKK